MCSDTLSPAAYVDDNNCTDGLLWKHQELNWWGLDFAIDCIDYITGIGKLHMRNTVEPLNTLLGTWPLSFSRGLSLSQRFFPSCNYDLHHKMNTVR